MRFGSRYGFLFTWKGININTQTQTHTHVHTHYSLFCTHLFKPSSLHIHSSHSRWFQHLADQSSDCLLQMETVFFNRYKRQWDKKKRRWYIGMCDFTICFAANVQAYKPQQDAIGCSCRTCYFGFISLSKASVLAHYCELQGEKQDNLCLHSSLLVKDTKNTDVTTVAQSIW